MRNTRRARGLIAGVGIAIAALTLAACGSGSVAADGSTASGAGSESSEADAPAGDTAGDTETVDAADPAGGIRPAGELRDSADVADYLDGRSYLSTGADGLTLVDGSTIELGFPEPGQVGLRAGCNGMFGPITWDGSTFAAPQLASTLMACDEALMQQDTDLAELFAGGLTAAVDGATLTLTGSGVTLEFTEQAAPSTPEAESGETGLEVPVEDGAATQPGD